MRGFTITTMAILLSCPIYAAQDTAENSAQTERGRFEITKVKINNKAFDPAKNEKIKLSFEITKDADVKVVIYDELSRKVRQFKIPGATAGEHSIEWDGHNAQRKPAAGRVFLYVIEAIDINGNKVVYNPAKDTAGLAVKAQDYSFDKETGKIEYVLPKTCMARFRAGLREGAFVRTILDWEPQAAGRHVLTWDGKDATGLLNIGNHPELDLDLACYTLPANSIIISGQGINFEVVEKRSKANSSTDTDIWARDGKYLHYGHDSRNCHEPKFTIMFPQHKKTNEEGLPLLSGRVPVRIDIDGNDVRYLINKRFEIVFYIDCVFLFEVEEGSSPFTCHWDTLGFSKGPHIMTVNLISYDDHIGTASRKIIIGDK